MSKADTYKATADILSANGMNDFAADKVNAVCGGTVNTVRGGTVNAVWGGTVNEVSGGTVITYVTMEMGIMTGASAVLVDRSGRVPKCFVGVQKAKRAKKTVKP